MREASALYHLTSFSLDSEPTPEASNAVWTTK